MVRPLIEHWKDDSQILAELTASGALVNGVITIQDASGERIKIDLLELLRFVNHLNSEVEDLKSESSASKRRIRVLEGMLRSLTQPKSKHTRRSIPTSIKNQSHANAKRVREIFGLPQKMDTKGSVVAEMDSMFEEFGGEEVDSVELLHSTRDE